MIPPPRKRAPRRQELWSGVVPSHRRSNGCRHEPCKIPETLNFWRFRNVHVRSSQPWQVPEILHQFFLHCCLDLLQHAPWKTLARLL